MKLDRIIKVADGAYPDGAVGECWDRKSQRPISAEQCAKDGPFDTLARFVAVELVETYDPKASNEEQADTAAAAIWRAVGELEDVARAIGTLQVRRGRRGKR